MEGARDEFGEVSTYPKSSLPRPKPPSPGAAGATAEAWGVDYLKICDFIVVEVFANILAVLADPKEQ